MTQESPSSEGKPIEKIRNPEELLDLIKEKGSPDLSEISQAERETFLNWYKTSELNDKDRVDFLEEFMRYSLVDDDTALGFIQSMNEEQKKQLGEYLGRTIKPGKYLQSFYECLPEVDFDIRQQLIKSLSVDSKGAIMVAPFRDLQKVQTGEVEDNYRAVSRKNVLESEFGSIEDAKKLLDALLKYYESHPDIQGHADRQVRESRISHRMLNRFYSGPAMNLENIVNYYLNNKAAVLYPYLEKLLDLGFLTEDQAKSLFEVGNQYILDRTKEEEKEVKRLTKKLKGSEDENFYLYSASEVVPQKYAFEIEEINDRGSVRSVENILTNFQAYRKRFGFNHTKFLMELMDRGAPIFSRVEQLGLSKEEVRSLILRSYQEEGNFFNLHGYGDMKALLDWNRQQKDSEGPDLEKTVTDLLIQKIGEGENASMAVHLRDILPWFEENNRNKIIKAINQRAPYLWLLSLSYAIENKVMPLGELITKSSQRSDHWFLAHFNNLLYHVSILKKEGKEVAVDLEDIRKAARRIILETPYHFLSKNLKYVIDQVFTEDERNNFIDGQLKKEPVDQDFFCVLIIQDEEGKYSKVCHDILLANPGLFVEMIEYSTSRFKKLLSIKEMTDLLIKTADSLGLDKVVDDELVLNLLESPQNLDRLLSALEQSNNSTGLIILAKTLGSIQEKDDTSIRSWKSNIETAKSNLRELANLRASASTSEKKELQLKIDKKRSELSRLEKNKPKERKTEQIREIARSYRDKLKEKIKNLCESEKFLVFHKDILDVLDNGAEELLRRDIEEYITIHPEVLMREYSRYGDKKRYGKLVFQEILGEEEFARLFRSRIRTLAFWSGRYGSSIDTKKLPENLSEQVKNVNPVLFLLERKHLEKDFYESTLGIAKNYQFYSLYSDRLGKMATEEAGTYGPRLETESFQPKAEFVALARIIFLLEGSDLAVRNKGAIFRLPAQQKEELIKMLGFISVYHLDEKLDFDLTEENYSEVREQVLSHILEFGKKLFEMEDAEIDINEPININTINALSTYYGKSCRENPIMKKAFHQMMIPILSGHYNNWRAWDSKEPPIDNSAGERSLESFKERGLLPKNLSLEQYKKWLEDESLNFSETFAYQISDIQSGIKDIFSLAVVDGHIEEATVDVDGFVLASNYNELIQPIRDLAKKQQEYKQRIQLSKKDKTQQLNEEEKQKYEDIKRNIKEYREDHEAEIKRVEALRYLDRIKKLSIEELELKSIFIDQKRIAFADVFKTLEEIFSDKPDFLSDIRRVRELLAEGNRQIFQGSRVSRSQLTITDRIDLETHVFIGEKPVESCQHYDGSDSNFGLLSYISDPAIKIGQIWDENGNIIARSIFRLMEDGNQNPQLFMERVYSINTHPKIKEAMIRLGVQKAKSIGIGIYTREEEYKDLTRERVSGEDKITLHSRGSRSPFAYTDAGGGKVPNGIFKVEIYN